jgi:hypothetical protein
MKKVLLVLIIVSCMCFANKNEMAKHEMAKSAMLKHINSSHTQMVGLTKKRQANNIDVLVRYEEHIENTQYFYDIMEFYVDDETSFYVINRNWTFGSKGSFANEGLEGFTRTKNAKEAVVAFFSRFKTGKNIETVIISNLPPKAAPQDTKAAPKDTLSEEVILEEIIIE